VDYEPIFFFSKSKTYWFEPQYEPYAPSSDVRYRQALHAGRSYNTKEPYRNNTPYAGNYKRGQGAVASRGDDSAGLVVGGHNPLGRNKRCVWTIPTQPFADAHFAVYPEELVETPIRAGCPEYICTKCGKAREKILKDVGEKTWNDTREKNHLVTGTSGLPFGRTAHIEMFGWNECKCNAGFKPGVVLDPFFGTGTTAIVAHHLNQSWVGIELSEEYICIAKRRLVEHGIQPSSASTAGVRTPLL
jgi:site-specific DNA-methyltransferase (adenine-specific)